MAVVASGAAVKDADERFAVTLGSAALDAAMAEVDGGSAVHDAWTAEMKRWYWVG